MFRVVLPLIIRSILLDIHVYWNILMMHEPISVISPNNTSKGQMRFNLLAPEFYI
jgi:ABC-type sulfate transport system substrate-binding protein